METVVDRDKSGDESSPDRSGPGLSERLNLVSDWVRDVIRDAYRHVDKADCMLMATGLSYVTLVSCIPVAALSFVIFDAFGGFERLMEVLQPFILQNLAEGAGAKMVEAIRNAASEIDPATLGAGGLIGLVVTSMALFSFVESAINRVWDTRTTRPLFQRIATYWLFLTLGPLVLAVLVGFTTSQTLSLRGIIPHGFWGFLLTALFFTFLYKAVPNRSVHLLSASAGAVFTTTLLQIARFGVSVYTSSVVAYSKIYGGLAFVAIMLLWIFLAWIVVLVGAALSVAVQGKLDEKVA